MIRFVAIAVGVMLLVLLMLKVARELRRADVDWSGVAFALGFVVLAFWLRHTTGMG